eukprot:6173742-Pleurochrysis_carterae.AAC.2
MPQGIVSTATTRLRAEARARRVHLICCSNSLSASTKGTAWSQGRKKPLTPSRTSRSPRCERQAREKALLVALSLPTQEHSECRTACDVNLEAAPGQRTAQNAAMTSTTSISPPRTTTRSRGVQQLEQLSTKACKLSFQRVRRRYLLAIDPIAPLSPACHARPRRCRREVAASGKGEGTHRSVKPWTIMRSAVRSRWQG